MADLHVEMAMNTMQLYIVHHDVMQAQLMFSPLVALHHALELCKQVWQQGAQMVANLLGHAVCVQT